MNTLKIQVPGTTIPVYFIPRDKVLVPSSSFDAPTRDYAPPPKKPPINIEQTILKALPATNAELAELIEKPQATVCRHLNRLMSLGLVLRQREDNRRYRYLPTRRGLAKRNEIRRRPDPPPLPHS